VRGSLAGVPLADTPYIDAHVHFWDPARLSYSWLSECPSIAGAHSPADLVAEAGGQRPHQVVFVQAECDRSRFLDEVSWVEALSEAEPSIAAIVAFAPMDRGAATAAALDRLGARPLVRGIRHLVQDDPDPDLCRRPEFVAGVREVGKRGLCFDLCLREKDLPAAVDLVRSCEGTPFVLDHAGKPGIAGHRLDPWRAHVEALAAFPNAVCKLSGLVTEASAATWTLEDLRPYVHHLLSCFGPARLLFGSDWPVVKLASSYARWLSTARILLEGVCLRDRQAIFFDNARRTYGLA